MNKLLGLFLAILVSSLLGDLVAQPAYFDGIFRVKATPQEGAPSVGSAILLGQRGGKYYFLTAKHVVTSSSLWGDEEVPIVIQERYSPTTYKAEIHSTIEELGDVAIIMMKVPRVPFPEQRFLIGRASKLRTGQGVTAVGFPDGKGQVNGSNQIQSAEKGVVGDQISFTATGMVPGYSGGALFKGKSRVLVGMIIQGAESEALAIRLDKILPYLERQHIPTDRIGFRRINPAALAILAVGGLTFLADGVYATQRITPIAEELNRVNALDGDSAIQPEARIVAGDPSNPLFEGTAEQALQEIDTYRSGRIVTLGVGGGLILGALITDLLTNQKQKKIKAGKIDP